MCRWRCALGPGWEVAAGAAEGQTQAAWAGPEAGASGGESVWSHPIDLRLRCTGRGGGAAAAMAGGVGGVWAWPKLEFTVLRADALLGQFCFSACGVAALPRAPGQHQLSCRTWRPNNAASWGSEELQGFLLGLHPAPADPACIVARDKARGMQTVGAGEVFLDLGVLQTAALLDMMSMPARDLGLGTLATKAGNGASWEAVAGIWGRDGDGLDATVSRGAQDTLVSEFDRGDSEEESEGLKLVRGGRHRRLLQQGSSQSTLLASPSQRSGGLRPLRSLRSLETRARSGAGDGASSVGSGTSSTREDRRRRVEELKAKRGARSLSRGNR